MDLDRLITRVEKNLTPKMAIVRWMTEAHEHGSVEGHFAWLQSQPPEAYPLMHLPEQVYFAARERMKGRPKAEIEREGCRVQQEVVFLHRLHDEINHHILRCREPLRLRVALLFEKYRTLIHETFDERQRLFDEFLERWDGKRDGPPEFDTEARKRLEDDKDSWTTSERALRREVTDYLQAAASLSKRYYSGCDVLFPATRQVLDTLLFALDGLRERYGEAIAPCVPRNNEELIVWMVTHGEQTALGATARRENKRRPPRTAGTSSELVEELLQAARIATLRVLGREQAALRLAEDWLVPGRENPADSTPHT
jgi:hypothetical protein